MPMVFFKHYPNCVVMIDSFVIFIGHLTNLIACMGPYIFFLQESPRCQLFNQRLPKMYSKFHFLWLVSHAEQVTDMSQSIAHCLVTWFQVAQFLLTLSLTFMTRLVSTVHD